MDEPKLFSSLVDISGVLPRHREVLVREDRDLQVRGGGMSTVETVHSEEEARQGVDGHDLRSPGGGGEHSADLLPEVAPRVQLLAYSCTARSTVTVTNEVGPHCRFFR